MITNSSVFQIYGAMARHAAEVQRISAENIAHASHPGYTAQRVESFEDYLGRLSATGNLSGSLSFETSLTDAPAAPNGNNVSVELETFESAGAAGRHQMAMSVYSQSIDLIRLSLGRR